MLLSVSKPEAWHVFSVGGLWSKFRAMVIVTTVLKAVSLFVAELISSITDWFQTNPVWANLEVLENTELKTTGGGESKNRNKQKILTWGLIALLCF